VFPVGVEAADLDAFLDFVGEAGYIYCGESGGGGG
jgi:hypothetical protein